jgi:two-component system LytT family response regulator
MMDKSISTIIVDDEQACIKTLCTDLEQYPEIEIIETLTSAEKAKKAILKQQPQLLFLDVEMPKTSGIELLQEIRAAIHSNICVVFYSAFDKYLIDALRASAFDYLLKPYLPEELSDIIERVKEKIRTRNANFEQSIRRLLSDDRKFALQTVTGLLLLRRSEILYFQYYNNTRSWHIILINQTTHKLRINTTAKEILNISLAFYQVSQDCIVNIDYLASIENTTFRCLFYPPYDKLDIAVTRRYYSKLKEALEII